MEETRAGEANAESRRETLGWLSKVGMVAGLVAAYGTLAAFMGRFLFPARPPARGWMFVTEVDRLGPGSALRYRTPAGAQVNIARQGKGEAASDFVALSSTCPHLGCQVHWESQNDRFFCPCHNGVFTPEGKAIAGPPAEAGQSLGRYPLKVDGGLLFIEVPLDEVALGPGEIVDDDYSPPGPGHDPCLYPCNCRDAAGRA
ncbi:MAG: Rieske 2Fe-2S domain-containing protein [Acidobacteria bacterium]|nr:Rieske 2Fe-2S domain-containing protein [Acidobacteriota bacterium]